MKKLFVEAIIKALSGIALVALLLFGSAGTLHYPNAWLLMAVLFIPMIVAGIVMLKKAPDRLKKRLHTKEANKDQIFVVVLSAIMFIAGFLVAGFDYKNEWSLISWNMSLVFAGVFLVGYAMYAEVIRENAYLSRVVEVQENQKVIDTGLYGIIRHPMYLATILMFASMPLVLGSMISFVVFLAYPAIILLRISGEEKLLETELPGYKEYKEKVKYRLIPYIW